MRRWWLALLLASPSAALAQGAVIETMEGLREAASPPAFREIGRAHV